MKTEIVDASEEGAIERCAGQLRRGELVAFPTETVYGLGANALDADAVEKIFEAKGRPATNPLISHVASIAAARRVAGEWPTAAEELAQAFWPGPLTLIVPKGDNVSDIVTAGLGSMGLRMPDHDVALRLIDAAGVPVAAPSANRYTEVSPTTADHVATGLAGRVRFVLDGGPTDVGIESTVLSLVTAVPTILRPGMIDADAIARVIGPVRQVEIRASDRVVRSSPGLSKRHYAPRVPLVLVDSIEDAIPFDGRQAVVASDRVESPIAHMLGDDPRDWARELYAILHRYGPEEVDRIAVVLPPEEPGWRAIRDRLSRAATSA